MIANTEYHDFYDDRTDAGIWLTDRTDALKENIDYVWWFF